MSTKARRPCLQPGLNLSSKADRSLLSTIVELDFSHVLKFQGATQTETVAPLPTCAPANDFLLWMRAGEFVVASFGMQSQVFKCRATELSIELSDIRAWAELPDATKLV